MDLPFSPTSDEYGSLFSGSSQNKLNQAVSKSLESGSVDTLILIDRQVDFITPMCTALTYEALIDDLIGIRNGCIQIDESLLKADNGETETSSSMEDENPKPKSRKKVPFHLNSNNDLYKEIRDESITVLMKKLNEKARKLKQIREQVNKSSEVSQLKQFVKQIPQMQETMKSLSNHINITQRLSRTTMGRAFRSRWHAERSILEGEQKLDYIEECIAKQEPWIRVLCLLCLQSLVGNGIKPTRYDMLRRDIVHAYGYEVVFTLDNLERLGLFKKKEGSSSWPTIRKAFKLIMDDVNPNDPADIAYVTSGYAPLSVRIIQLAINPGWSAGLERMKMVPGVTICEVRQPGVQPPEMVKTEKQESWKSGESGVKIRNKRKMVVFFTGGVTFAEISAIRFLNKQEDNPFEIIVATTKLINGCSLLRSVTHTMANSFNN